VKVASESQPPLDLVHRPAQLLTRIHVEHVRVKIQGVFDDAGFEKSERKKVREMQAVATRTFPSE
jgi:hypothetical protein